MREWNIVIKDNSFNPSPVAGNIPIFADSRTNSDCIGTPNWKEFWEEQFYYCKHGYKTGGIWLPGEYYYFLNHKVIDGVNGGTIHPYYVDSQYHLQRMIFDIRHDPEYAGAILPKVRRFGLSFQFANIVDYGMRFRENYSAGVAAGMDTWVSGFRSKLKRTYNNVSPEMMLSSLKLADEEFIFGWSEKTDSGFIDKINSRVLFKTMKDDGAKLEGEYFHDVIMEELGEFEKAEQTLVSTTPALKRGATFYGKSWGYGTGGNMNKSGKVFMNIYNNRKYYNLEGMFIDGSFNFHPYFVMPGKSYKTPNLDHLIKEKGEKSLWGCEDRLAANKKLDEDEFRYMKLSDKSFYIQHKQNYPRKIEDVFTSSGSNNFNAEKLSVQNYKISSGEVEKPGEFVLEYAKEKNGEYKTPIEVVARPFKETDKEWQKVLIYRKPRKGYINLDIVGIDSYDMDQTRTSTSLGAVVVLRRSMFLEEKELDDDINGLVPVCYYMQRPPRKELFYDIALKISIFYNAKRNTMISADEERIFGYYKDNGGRKYLSYRPKSFDSPEGKQIHDYGFKATSFSLPRMLSLLQSWVEDYSETNVFMALNNDLMAYDEANIGTDYDSADALGHALIRNSDMKGTPKLEDKNDYSNKYNINHNNSFKKRDAFNDDLFDDQENIDVENSNIDERYLL